MIFSFATGLILGISAGITPGPLLALIIGQALNYGVKEGAKVAIAPLLTDLPIIAIAFIIVWRLSTIHWIPGLLSLAGAGYIAYLAWENMRIALPNSGPAEMDAKSMQRGALVNLLNPHPYMFWLTVGVPFLSKTWATAPPAAVLWVAGFYIALVGSKLVLAFIIGHGREFLKSSIYLWFNRVLALVLLFFAVLLAKHGLTLLMNSVPTRFS